MTCAYDKEMLTWLLANPMDETRRLELENHVAGCLDCKRELENSRELWELLEEIPNPEPSPVMREGFYAMLANYKKREGVANRSPWQILGDRFRQLWSLQPRLQFAYSLALIALGIAAGYLLNHPVRTELAEKSQINALSSQVQEMKQMMMLSLLENPSASERIRGVAFTDEIHNANSQVIAALLTTLNNDPNVNVRLMTLEALAKFSDQPTVREGLVQSIIQQESPLVQSAMADIMVKLQEKKSIKPLRELLNRKDINETVKSKIEQSIQKLI